MLWIILNILVFLGALGGLAYVMGKKVVAIDRKVRANFETLEAEKEAREGILRELAAAVLGLAPSGHFELLKQRLEEMEEAIRAEKGRLTITEAELEAVDVRLRELEELKRELEVSNMDVIKELEMLRSQERDINAKNEALRNQLENSAEQLDTLLLTLASSAEVCERLNSLKTELVNTQKQCVFYEEQISAINTNYMALKKAYDALDIEYAQLYEKQQSRDDP